MVKNNFFWKNKNFWSKINFFVKIKFFLCQKSRFVSKIDNNFLDKFDATTISEDRTSFDTIVTNLKKYQNREDHVKRVVKKAKEKVFDEQREKYLLRSDRQGFSNFARMKQTESLHSLRTISVVDIFGLYQSMTKLERYDAKNRQQK